MKKQENAKRDIYWDILNDTDITSDKYLQAFGAFISSNPDSLYNMSYYTDRINDFKTAITILKDKKSLYDRLLKNMDFPVDFKVTFDDFMCYDNSEKSELINTQTFRFDKVNNAVLCCITANNEKFTANFQFSTLEEDFKKFVEDINKHL